MKAKKRAVAETPPAEPEWGPSQVVESNPSDDYSYGTEDGADFCVSAYYYYEDYQGMPAGSCIP